MLVHRINDDLIYIRLPSLTKKFDENKIKEVDGCIVLNKIDLLQRAQKCFMQAIHLKPRSAVYWSCLAQCVYIQARYNSNDQRMFTLALEYLKIAISLKPNDHLLWNALGVVAAHPVLNESGFAQHCFFKSLQLQRTAVGYTNLGFLYYRHENMQLANKAFSNAQQTDPMYSLAWIGQALIAEKIDYNESIDLYRHCVDLSNHSQGLYGYGKAIANLLIKPENKSTDVYQYSINYLTGNQRAADALTKYIQRNPKDTNALQCLGIIHEFNQRFIQAANAYQLSFTQMNQQNEIAKMIRNDYARVKCRIGQVQIDAFVLKDIKITLLDILWLAIAYGRVNKRTDAIEILKRAIDDATISNKDRSILLTFLGLYQREIDPQLAVKNLFKSYQTKPVCSSAITALCAMGMLTSDNRISLAALKEMPKLTDSNYTMDIHLLTCLSMFLTNKTREAYSYTMNALHNTPWLSWTWILAVIARIQIGNQAGVLEIIEGICQSNFSTINERMAILVAKILHLLSPERNQRILHLFQMLIIHRPGN
jgi:tetratricopeptide (TPR) repeat protein